MTEQGRKIEDGSFAVIDHEVGPHPFSPPEWQVVRRVIHSTADFEYKELTRIHPNAIQAGVKALWKGCPVLVDVTMISSGLSRERLEFFGCTVRGFISDDDVIQTAKQKNSTRAIEAMLKAHSLGLVDGAIIAIGNAPTALIEVARLIRDLGARPALVVGVPVGFISAAESKEIIQAQSEVPWIVTSGRKGGSPIAVAILHALMYLAVDQGRPVVDTAARAKAKGDLL
jgi:precorrin-8X/cobalt-precorrin-8 methylmutase